MKKLKKQNWSYDPWFTKYYVNEISDEFLLFGTKIKPIPVYHGMLPVLGYRINDFAYLTDVNNIPLKAQDSLKGLKVLVLGVLREKPHSTHFCVEEALAVVENLRPEKIYFTHLGHMLEHEDLEKRLPEHIRLAYDGLILQI